MAKSRVDAENFIKTLVGQVVSVVDIKVRRRFEQNFLFRVFIPPLLALKTTFVFHTLDSYQIIFTSFLHLTKNGFGTYSFAYSRNMAATICLHIWLHLRA